MKRSLETLSENFLTSNETIHKQKNFRTVSSKVIPVCGYIREMCEYSRFGAPSGMP
ncbi:MAG: hypothetical protein IKN47_03905 [Lachnospiraceae bacterium]|nr:hypothetical protein [Lachnospiraceae bacterium]